MNDGQPDTALLALIREHGQPAPAASVDWDALAARSGEDGRGELAARHRAAQDGGGARTLARRLAPHRWWEVTAGWARPAIAAAVVVCAISAAVVFESPAAANTDAPDSTAAAWVQTFGATNVAAVTTPVSRDSLLSEVVGQ